ncbi:2-hydroxyacid dehydrogenase [Pseudomonas sp. R5-89-07]|uniref:2-hydroxyacid dehydrogenase n=1 Tax=Pseudomonas sp. R5-89-07 TaxID=658644 RepID=UPI000F56FF8A|nr:D-isomer specific 2-hydroxyacid dehydrogenase family protein [Pseudomonas sp. R5-89-07]AZF04828.1 D-3-phosphoglycerate dehydrogenase [Pseudomonas sp. R5-89-07]
MSAVFIDCTPELNVLFEAGRLVIPQDTYIHVGDPTAVDVIALCQTAQVMLVEHTAITAQTLAACPHLKAIVFMGTGAGAYLPLEWAKANNIAVSTTPGYGSTAVAEHAMALTFAAARKLGPMVKDIVRGVWLPRGGMQLKGRKVAVIGFGEVGRCYAEMASALGMCVSAWNRTPVDTAYFEADIERVLAGAEVVSLHLALNDDTAGFLNASGLRLLSPGALVINTARAGLIDQDDLAQALQSGQVGHAALDVFWQEPIEANDPWCDAQNVTLTPHAAYMTEEAYIELWKRTLKAMDAHMPR